MKKQLLICFLIIVAYIIFFGLKYNSPFAGDEKKIHFSQISYFVEAGFSPQYKQISPMTPGSHLILATCINIFGNLFASDLHCARFINSLFTLTLLLFITLEFYSINPFLASIVILPLYASHYIWYEFIWIMSDNGALLWVTVTISLLFRKPNLKNLWLISIFVTMAILWRQVYIWLLAPFYIYCYQYKAYYSSYYWQQLLCLTLPVFVLFYFFYLWGGLYPTTLAPQLSITMLITLFCFFLLVISASLRQKSSILEKLAKLLLNYNTILLIALYLVFLYGGNIRKNTKACFVLAISLFGCYSLCYLAIFFDRCVKLLKEKYSIFLLGIFLALPILLFAPKPIFPRGVYGGPLWVFASYLPDIANYSLLFWGLFPLGVCSCLMWFYITPKNNQLTFSCLFVPWISAQSLAPFAYQRHYEVWLLIFLSYLSLFQEKPKKIYRTGILSLSFIMITISIIKYIL